MKRDDTYIARAAFAVLALIRRMSVATTKRIAGTRSIQSLWQAFFPLVIFLLVGVTHAATITVTSTGDNGPGSLRDAVATADPFDTIAFGLSGCPCTITLTTGEIVIDKALFITGPGADQITVSGNNSSRIFRVIAFAEIGGLT